MHITIQKMEWNKFNQLIVAAEKIVEFTAIQTYRGVPVAYLRWPQTGVLAFSLETGYGDDSDITFWRISPTNLQELRDKAEKRGPLSVRENYEPPRPVESRRPARAPKVDPRQISLFEC